MLRIILDKECLQLKKKKCLQQKKRMLATKICQPLTLQLCVSQPFILQTSLDSFKRGIKALLDERRVKTQCGDRMTGMVLSSGDSLHAQTVTASSDHNI